MPLWNAWPNWSNGIEDLRDRRPTRPKIDRALLLQLAHDLPAAWNAPSTDTRTKQRLIHILVQEIVCKLDDAPNEAVLLIHWTGGRHTEVRVLASRPAATQPTRRPPPSMHFASLPVTGRIENLPCRSIGCAAKPAMARPGRQFACGRCANALGSPSMIRLMLTSTEMISLARRPSVLASAWGPPKALRLRGILPATQILPGSPWLVPAASFASEAVQIGVQRVVSRRPKIYEDYQYDKAIRLPGL